MAFQILNENKKPVSIGELDKEACEFWGKELHQKDYAYPQFKPESFPTEEYKSSYQFYSSLSNWFDKIGWLISEGAESWEEVIKKIMEPFQEFPIDVQEEIENYYLPVSGYVALCKHWKSKGYTPKQIIL
jgi:hypothetical protein